MRRIIPALLVLVLCTALPAASQGIVDAAVDGSSISVKVSLPGGIGADVGIRFAEVTGLSVENLGLSAALVNPLSLRSRLPSGVLPAMPLLLRIEPPADGSLSFSGVTEIDIHTQNLHYFVGSPLRFFSAPLGGKFEDVTTVMGSGSYRARATKGGFSEFLIVIDLRPRHQVIAHKLDRLEAMLAAYEGTMPGSVHAELAERLEAVSAAHGAGDRPGAIEEIDGFLGVVEQHSGTDIPALWRAARDVENVAGHLREGALTLRFSLGLKSLFGH